MSILYKYHLSKIRVLFSLFVRVLVWYLSNVVSAFCDKYAAYSEVALNEHLTQWYLATELVHM